MKIAMEKNFDPAGEWRSQVPVPVCDAHPEFIELYWKAWELAHDHILDVPGMPQTPYMDEAFCDTDIWIWDSCFMSLFCKYAQSRFPGIETLENFYRVLYGSEHLPVIITRNAPAWTGEVIGKTAQVRIHLLDNPPLFSWAEYQNAQFSGDRAHVIELLEHRQYLQRHFFRLESLNDRCHDSCIRAESCLRKHELGYFWEGGRSGMDNTPRGRRGTHAAESRPNNPDMLWIDAIAQQGLSALEIARLAELTGNLECHAEWMKRYGQFKALVNQYYWDDVDGFYYDIHAQTHAFMRVMTPASFWPVIAEMATPEQVDRMCEKLEASNQLGGEVPCLSLARDDADFDAEHGCYWRGALWIPVAYMVLKGIEKYNKFQLARQLSERILAQMSRVYREFEPHTIWECYSPNRPEPAYTGDAEPGWVRRDFCGWSALAPIALLIENIIGIHSVDAFTLRVEWALPESVSGRIGVQNLRFGNTVTSLEYEDGLCAVTSNAPYMLAINGTEFPIKAGHQHFPVC